MPGRSRSRSPTGKRDRRRSRSRSRERRHRKKRSRSRERDRSPRRRASPQRHRSRSHSPRRRSNSPRRHSNSKERDLDKKFQDDEVIVIDGDLKPDGIDDEQVDMMKLMGFSTFDTTKGKKVEGNNVSAVNLQRKRRYRQYMNRRGGFNRPLDFVA